MTPIQDEHVPDSFLREFWNHFKPNKGAVVGLALIIAFVIIAILAPLLAPYDPTLLQDNALRLPPIWAEAGTWSYPLGTDDVGRDILSRLIHGARISMGIGFAVVILSLSMGLFLGIFAGYYGGKVDRLIMRFIDIVMAFPSILLAITVVSVMGPGISNAIIAVAIVAVPNFTRIVRASVMAERKKQYVMASKTFGASDLRIMFNEILPNCLAPLIVQATLGFSDGILNAAALGFLGLGAQPPTPEWGTMLADSRPFIESSPWMVTLPGLCILFSVLGFNLFGDGLRDALDPRLKK
ncbi:MAG: diguanylate cyclase [Bdellovibrionales bacterium CG12_big_fil_rev_8_21_14_0_65_38_15]|nr:MAG: diguanylate cyclase [Bdellovibrionales bacterium CG22_combo_CG10-13_8_21_14_all_38_13]PIQ56184.1 MAG: diguanylate cyclase [Bdellovibrionales bacterium CG12_big_fil_rev_8_21_14_0_65_38_15]PIR28830.1 MAG: diguanylate cyclase [Bdellovibrionales bacterium CG11_big_fil_rev_8_21_14_0_20_38_13]